MEFLDRFFMYKRMDVPPQTWPLRRPLNHISNYVLFVVIVWYYSVMDMKYFTHIDIIDEYVKKRAEKFDSSTIMKMK